MTDVQGTDTHARDPTPQLHHGAAPNFNHDQYQAGLGPFFKRGVLKREPEPQTEHIRFTYSKAPKPALNISRPGLSPPAATPSEQLQQDLARNVESISYQNQAQSKPGIANASQEAVAAESEQFTPPSAQRVDTSPRPAGQREPDTSRSQAVLKQERAKAKTLPGLKRQIPSPTNTPRKRSPEEIKRRAERAESLRIKDDDIRGSRPIQSLSEVPVTHHCLQEHEAPGINHEQVSEEVGHVDAIDQLPELDPQSLSISKRQAQYNSPPNADGMGFDNLEKPFDHGSSQAAEKLTILVDDSDDESSTTVSSSPPLTSNELVAQPEAQIQGSSAVSEIQERQFQAALLSPTSDHMVPETAPNDELQSGKEAMPGSVPALYTPPGQVEALPVTHAPQPAADKSQYQIKGSTVSASPSRRRNIRSRSIPKSKSKDKDFTHQLTQPAKVSKHTESDVLPQRGSNENPHNGKLDIVHAKVPPPLSRVVNSGDGQDDAGSSGSASRSLQRGNEQSGQQMVSSSRLPTNLQDLQLGFDVYEKTKFLQFAQETEQIAKQLEAELQECQVDNENLALEVEELEAESNLLLAKAHEKSKGLETEMNSLRTETAKEVSVFQANEEKLISELTTLKVDAAKRQSESKGSQNLVNKLAQLQRYMQGLTNDQQTFRREINQHQTNLAALTRENMGIGANHDNVETHTSAAINARQKIIDALKERVTDLETQLAKRNAEIERLESRFSGGTEVRTIFQEEIAKLRTDDTVLTQLFTNFKSELNTQLDKLKAAASSGGETAQTDHQRFHSDVIAEFGKVKDAVRAVSETIANTPRSASILPDSGGQLSKLQADVGAVASAVHDVNEQVAKSADLEDIASSATAIRATLEKLRKGMTTRQKHFETEAKLRADISRLTADLGHATSALQRSEADNDDLYNQCKAQKEKVSCLENDVNKLSSLRDSNETLKSDLAQSNEKLTAKVQEHAAERQGLEVTINNLKQQLLDASQTAQVEEGHQTADVQAQVELQVGEIRKNLVEAANAEKRELIRKLGHELQKARLEVNRQKQNVVNLQDKHYDWRAKERERAITCKTQLQDDFKSKLAPLIADVDVNSMDVDGVIGALSTLIESLQAKTPPANMKATLQQRSGGTHAPLDFRHGYQAQIEVPLDLATGETQALANLGLDSQTGETQALARLGLQPHTGDSQQLEELEIGQSQPMTDLLQFDAEDFDVPIDAMGNPLGLPTRLVPGEQSSNQATGPAAPEVPSTPRRSAQISFADIQNSCSPIGDTQDLFPPNTAGSRPASNQGARRSSSYFRTQDAKDLAIRETMDGLRKMPFQNNASSTARPSAKGTGRHSTQNGKTGGAIAKATKPKRNSYVTIPGRPSSAHQAHAMAYDAEGKSQQVETQLQLALGPMLGTSSTLSSLVSEIEDEEIADDEDAQLGREASLKKKVNSQRYEADIESQGQRNQKSKKPIQRPTSPLKRKHEAADANPRKKRTTSTAKRNTSVAGREGLGPTISSPAGMPGKAAVKATRKQSSLKYIERFNASYTNHTVREG